LPQVATNLEVWKALPPLRGVITTKNYTDAQTSARSRGLVMWPKQIGKCFLLSLAFFLAQLTPLWAQDDIDTTSKRMPKLIHSRDKMLLVRPTPTSSSG
jgi:hypothetical protein